MIKRLPTELILAVLAKYDPISLLQARNVCRSWLRLIRETESLWRVVAVQCGLNYGTISTIGDGSNHASNLFRNIIRSYRLQQSVSNLNYFNRQTVKARIRKDDDDRDLCHLLMDGNVLICAHRHSRFIYIYEIQGNLIKRRHVFKLDQRLQAMYLIPRTEWTKASYLMVVVDCPSHVILYNLESLFRIQISRFSMQRQPAHDHVPGSTKQQVSLTVLVQAPANLVVRICSPMGAANFSVRFDAEDRLLPPMPSVSVLHGELCWMDVERLEGDWINTWYLQIGAGCVGVCIDGQGNIGMVDLAGPLPVAMKSYSILSDLKRLLTDKMTKSHAYVTSAKLCTEGWYSGYLIVGWSTGHLVCYQTDLESWSLLWIIPEAHNDCIYAMAISWNLSRVITASWDKTMKIWELRNGCLLSQTRLQSSCLSLALNENSNGFLTIAVGCYDGTMELFQFDSKSRQHSHPNFTNPNPLSVWIGSHNF